MKEVEFDEQAIRKQLSKQFNQKHFWYIPTHIAYWFAMITQVIGVFSGLIVQKTFFGMIFEVIMMYLLVRYKQRVISKQVENILNEI